MEAADLAPQVFEELGLSIAPRLSQPAIIAAARLSARHFLDDCRQTPRELVNQLGRMHYAAAFPDEQADFAGLDDWYILIEHGAIPGGHSDIDQSVIAAAQALVEGRPRLHVAVDRLFTGGESTPTSSRWPVPPPRRRARRRSVWAAARWRSKRSRS